MLVVGIDSGKDRVDAVAMQGEEVLDHFTVDFGGKHLARGISLKRISANTRFWLDSLRVTMRERPVVFIEESIVMTKDLRTSVHLAETVGMLLALPYDTDVVPISSWKMLSIGNGGASKEKVRETIALRFPAAAQLFGKRQDLFDATGVAVFGVANAGVPF